MQGKNLKFRIEFADNVTMAEAREKFLRLLLCGFPLFLSACDQGTVHVLKRPNGRVKETWIEKGPEGKPTAREGLFQSYYPDGRRESSIEYHLGRKDGDAKIWDREGRLVFEGSYRDDFLVREIRFDAGGKEVFDREYRVRREKAPAPGPDGDTLAATETCAYYEEGGVSLRHGLCRMAYPEGALLSTRYFSRGRLQGPVQAWHSGGTRWMSGAYDKSEPDGAWSAWSRSGKPLWAGRFAAGLKTGAWKEWFPGGGIRSESRWRGGRLEGPYRECYLGGRTRLECGYRGGLKDGDETAFFPDGRKLYSARYVSGRLQGDFLQWYADGRLRLACRFKDGKKEGPSRVWDRGGGLIEEAFYAAGRLQGRYRSWTPDGRPLAVKEFRAGAVAYDSKARELMNLLGIDARGPTPSVPVGIEGFYWGMDRKECEGNLALLQAEGLRAEADGLSARITAFADRRPTPARVRLQFNPQGELWGVKLELLQKSSADYFPLCESLEAELGGGLGATGLRKGPPGPGGAAPYDITRKRDWGSFTVTSGGPAVRQRLPVLSAEAFSPGTSGWFRFSLSNNLYREYANPANASISQPAWRDEAFLAGR
jgi:antitoxin component YwqK of YwqJK toxin-antitoxin module